MIKGMALPKGGSKLPLVLGLVLGGAAAVLIAVYLSSAGGSDTGSSGGSAGDVLVLVANQNIASGTRITAEMIATKNFVQADVLLGSFSNPEDVVDSVTTVPIVAGEQVISAKITGSETALEAFGDNPPLSLLLKPGQRAVSVEVSSLIGAGGLIRPGDYVDIILSVKVKSDDGSGGSAESAGSNQIAATVIQNVLVLAIGQNVRDVVANPGEQTEDHNDEATTVTLAVTPIQGEVLSVSDTCRLNFDGRLALALRAQGDQEIVQGRTEFNESGIPDCAAVLGIAALP